MTSKEWTVIGLWLGDEPITAGVVAGRHDVGGGNISGDGCWFTYVTAVDAQDAAQCAVDGMRVILREQWDES